jgi:hypothetical protein
MNFHHGAIQRERLDPDAYDLCTLQFREYAIQNAASGPAVHPRVNRMSSTEALRQSAPLAAMLGDIENRIEHLQVRQADVAALSWQTMLDPLISSFGDFHHPSMRSSDVSVNTP